MSDTLTIRRATPDDAPAIARHRRLMFEAMGFTDPARLDAAETAAVPWITDRIAREEYLGWLAVTADGFAASGAGLWVREFPPGPRDMCGRRGYIFNVYTYPDFRRRGLARTLVCRALDWCRDSGINSVTLHASHDGQPIYEAIGFKMNNEMIVWTADLPHEV
jgi:ribosomal protein S18 acetylase RimI-like enzyme